ILAASNNPGGGGPYKAQSTQYDLMGRAAKQSNPADVDSAWNPTGPDDAAGWLYTQQTYDWKGRPKVTTNTDGTQKSASYDGYGRLQSRHAPAQDAGRNITYAYNPDDTLASVTDARGAVTTYSYNDNRHLVTGVSYTAPAGITTTPSVTFTYDAAGNRTRMDD